MRLIDADALIDALMVYTWRDEDERLIDDADEKREFIKNWMPDLQTVEITKEQHEIVRCKDCKHRTRRICNNIEFWECNHIRYELAKCGVTDDWFCADGEVKQDGEETN